MKTRLVSRHGHRGLRRSSSAEERQMNRRLLNYFGS
jgi:hypothetical protein